MHIYNCLLCYHCITYVFVHWQKTNVFKTRSDILNLGTSDGLLCSVIIFFYHLLALKIFVERVVGRKESDGKITRSVLPTELSALVTDHVINENKDSAARV